MKKFNDWYNQINEDLGEPVAKTTHTETTAQSANVDSGRKDMIQDIDTIITSLEVLSGELKEELVNESGLATVAGAAAAGAALASLGKGAKKLYDASITAPKARKAQAKVNVMNLKVAGVENMISSADKEQKDKLKAKLEASKEAAKELQTSVDDRYANASNIVKKALSSEKAKGKMEVLKATIGDASPEQQKQIKDQLIKLKNQITQDDAEFQQEVKGAKEETPAEELDKVKELKGKTGTVGKDDGADEKTKKEREIKNSKDGMLARLNDKMKKAKESGDEEKIKKIQDLIDRVSAKEAWQLENTELGRIFEAEVAKLEMEFILNESKYITNSIKDRFSKLL